jgi:hypothetical protein
MKAVTAAANVASAGVPALSADCSLLPAGVRFACEGAAARLGVAPDRRPVPDRVARRFPGSSAGLMTRAYVSLIRFSRGVAQFHAETPCFMRV